MKLLLDEQISPRVAERLRQRGHDVVAVAEQAALRGLADPELFDIAQTQERAVVTYNRADFEALVREYAQAGRQHHGLAIVHPLRLPGSDLRRLCAALEKFIEEPRRGMSFMAWLAG